MTSDTEAARAFYKQAIGWTMADSGLTDRDYTILSAGATPVGGLMPIPQASRDAGAMPCWMGYIGVDDVDAYAGKVKTAGGSIHRGPEDIPNVGRFAVAADPHGAIFLLFKGMGGQMPAEAAPDAPGHIGWRELHAGDGPAAFAFLFGPLRLGEGLRHGYGADGRLPDIYRWRRAARRGDDKDGADADAVLALLFQRGCAR